MLHSDLAAMHQKTNKFLYETEHEVTTKTNEQPTVRPTA